LEKEREIKVFAIDRPGWMKGASNFFSLAKEMLL
jgi:hypothetical protein